MSFFDKVKWILGIMMVFFIVLATNLIDKQNFTLVKNSVVTIFEDRLVANDILFKMADLLHQKELAIVTANTEFFENSNSVVNSGFYDLIAQYELTKLTESESRNFESLKRNYEQVVEAERSTLMSNFSDKTSVLNAISKVKINLTTLSKIQIDQGRRQVLISEKAMNSIEFFTQIEIYILILLAVLVQILVIYKPK